MPVPRGNPLVGDLAGKCLRIWRNLRPLLMAFLAGVIVALVGVLTCVPTSK